MFLQELVLFQVSSSLFFVKTSKFLTERAAGVRASASGTICTMPATKLKKVFPNLEFATNID